MRRILIILFVFISSIAYADYTNQDYCNAIWIIEGGEKTNYPYGIKSVKCKGKEDCEQVCLNTVRNNRIRFKNQSKEKDFNSFLAKRYCPDDWKNWLRNLNYFLARP